MAAEDESRSTHPEADRTGGEVAGEYLPDADEIDEIMGTLPDTVEIPVDGKTALQFTLMCHQYGHDMVAQNIGANLHDLLDDIHVQLQQLEQQQAAQQAAQQSAAQSDAAPDDQGE